MVERLIESNASIVADLQEDSKKKKDLSLVRSHESVNLFREEVKAGEIDFLHQGVVLRSDQ